MSITHDYYGYDQDWGDDDEPMYLVTEALALVDRLAAAQRDLFSDYAAEQMLPVYVHRYLIRLNTAHMHAEQRLSRRLAVELLN